MEVNEVPLESACVDFSSGVKKQDSKTTKVTWEAPWGKIGDTLALGLPHRVPGENPGYVSSIYAYQAKAPAATQQIASIEKEKSIEKPSESIPNIDRINDWSEAWESNFGQMALQQSGNSVTGTYSHDQGRMRGIISGNKMKGAWSESPSYNPPNYAGDLELVMSGDSKSFSGNWRYGSSGGWSGSWSGTRNNSVSRSIPTNIDQISASGTEAANHPERASWNEPYPESKTISGTWYMGGPINAGMPCQIILEGDVLTITNEDGQKSTGRIIDSYTIEATNWDKLRGTLSGDRNRIGWANGSWWIRSNAAV